MSGGLRSQKNFYSVINGRQTGVFVGWSSAKQSIGGLSNPRCHYQGFELFEDAVKYMEEHGISKDDICVIDSDGVAFSMNSLAASMSAPAICNVSVGTPECDDEFLENEDPPEYDASIESDTLAQHIQDEAMSLVDMISTPSDGEGSFDMLSNHPMEMNHVMIWLG